MDCDVIKTAEWNKQIMSSVVFLSSHPQNIINKFYFDLPQPHSKFISCYKSISTNWKAALKCLFGFSSLSLPQDSTTNTLHHLKHFSVTTQNLQELFKYIFFFFWFLLLMSRLFNFWTGRAKCSLMTDCSGILFNSDLKQVKYNMTWTSNRF